MNNQLADLMRLDVAHATLSSQAEAKEQRGELGRLCEVDCNRCLSRFGSGARVVSLILNKLHRRFGSEVYAIVQPICPNLTCCADCHIDDFVHIEGCEIDEEAKRAERTTLTNNGPSTPAAGDGK